MRCAQSIFWCIEPQISLPLHWLWTSVIGWATDFGKLGEQKASKHADRDLLILLSGSVEQGAYLDLGTEQNREFLRSAFALHCFTARNCCSYTHVQPCLNGNRPCERSSTSDIITWLNARQISHVLMQHSKTCLMGQSCDVVTWDLYKLCVQGRILP